MLSRPFVLGSLALVLSVAACAPSASRSGAPPVVPSPPPEHVIHATPTIITPHDDASAIETFERARALLLEGKPADAAVTFEQVVALEPGGPLTAGALFNAGVAWETAADRGRALEKFREVVRRFPDGDVGKPAALRAARLYAYFERWSELSGVADLLLAHPDLTDVEKLEADGAKALSLAEIGDVDAAEKYVSRGRDIVEALRLGEGGKLPVAVAQVEFALGEIRKLRSEKITFIPLPKNFGEALERRCQGVLDAQSAYTDAMRSYDAHWAAMSGYRVGQLYLQLHGDLMAIQPPKAVDTEAKKRLFEGAMRLRYRVLLEKGLKMMSSTVSLGERTGEASDWIGRAREAKVDMERALAQEKAELAKLPYTEQDLKKAFDDLGKKSATP